MTVLYESSSSDLESQFGSPLVHGYHNSFAGHLREANIIDRSRASTSPFFLKFEMSPTSVPMDHTFSASSLSDSDIAPDWNFNFNVPLNEPEPTSPMSTHQAFQDFIPNWHPVNFTAPQQRMNIPASQPGQTNDNYGFSFSQHQYPTGQQTLNSKAAVF
jgi:hypothetical protein